MRKMFIKVAVFKDKGGMERKCTIKDDKDIELIEQTNDWKFIKTLMHQIDD